MFCKCISDREVYVRVEIFIHFRRKKLQFVCCKQVSPLMSKPRLPWSERPMKVEKKSLQSICWTGNPTGCGFSRWPLENSIHPDFFNEMAQIHVTLRPDRCIKGPVYGQLKYVNKLCDVTAAVRSERPVHFVHLRRSNIRIFLSKMRDTTDRAMGKHSFRFLFLT